MKISKDCVVCLDYTIRLAGGKMVETSFGAEPLTYLHGRRQIVPGVEQALEGMEEGTRADVVVGPKGAYGDRDPSGVFIVPRHAFPEGESVEAGMSFAAHRPDGSTLTLRVVEANSELVLVDSNHPLAGETLYISLQVHSVREARADELSLGQPNPHSVPPQPYLA